MIACWSLLLFLIPSGCATRVTSAIPSARQAELRSTPGGVVQLFESGWNERDLTTLSSLFTSDFALGGKSPGPEGLAAFRVSCRVRAMRMPCDSAWGGGDFGALARSRMTLGPWSPPLPDYPRIAETRWRRYVYCTLRIEEGAGRAEERLWTRTMHKVATFCLVRGDSAAVTPGLAAAGTAPDSTRWWLKSLTVEIEPGYPGSKERPYLGFICGNARGDFWWP
jgi:hypothetical protein